ncbi:related to DASH complex subunit spc19 (Outer kinetochore protein spc19) [Melanopsichium pennsylvanicum]|uniref:DASH complex subunit SPC19 n=1 Tax=Melanopsichium pennsylvanicum TaxID=63383 RepID=A0AAJ5C5K8_9BASI|nr:related to DASH complex subunit spc19 (Outer kinetochore protein spc19) [Melanopsichium pennsylvanicum]
MLASRQSSFPQQGQQQYDAHYAQQMHATPPQPSQHLIHSLHSCVNSTAACVQTMKEAIDTLEFAIQDHPRLMTVLKSQRHFDLVSQHDIDQAREHVASEVRPHVEELCRRATSEIQRQDRRAVALKNKNEALQQRIANLRSIESHQSKLTGPSTITTTTTTNSNKTNNSITTTPSDAAVRQAHKSAETEEQKQLNFKLEKRQETLEGLRRRKEALLAKVDELESETNGLL